MKHGQFFSYTLNEDRIEKIEAIRSKFDELLTYLESVCTDQREFSLRKHLESVADERDFSLTKTKLEEAYFFAVKAMCMNLINQLSY